MALLWNLYQRGLSYAQIAEHLGVSSSTIKRKLRGVEESYTPPKLSGGVVHIDVTYWGRNQGLILALDAKTRIPLYHKWIGHEHLQDYVDAIDGIKAIGYKIEALVLDGGVGLEIGKQLHIVQMCQYHFIAIIRRKLTLRPQMEASKELLWLARSVTKSNRKDFTGAFTNWLKKWDSFLKERTINPITNQSQYTHRSLRSAVQTFREKLPFLFSHQDYPDLEIPNTNNAIEGVFTALKSALRNHNGMSQENKERFVVGFFRHRGYRLNDCNEKGE